MPTYEADRVFLRDWVRLTAEQQRRFKTAVSRFVEDLKAKRPPRKGLGIERFEAHEDVYEFHWAPNGRALFSYGVSPHPGDIHIIWLRIGTHDIYKG